MAAEYEVNIKLNSGKAKDELEQLDSTVKKIQKTEKESASTTDRRKAALIKLREVGSQVQALADKGLKVSKARFQLKEAGKNIEKGELAAANQRIQIVNKEISAQKRLTNELKRQAQARKRKGSQRRESIALGIGFPLLFGGGGGSVIGGGIGGVTGSFGAQIAFSAIGQQFDAFIASAAQTGKALTSTGGALDFVREKSLFSSKESEALAAKLEEQGDVSGLASLLTEELTSKIGTDGILALQSLGTETDKVTKQWNELTLGLESLIAGPLASFLAIVNRVLGVKVAQNRLETALSTAMDVAPGRKKEIEALMESERNAGVNVRGFLSRAMSASLSPINLAKSVIKTATGEADIQGFDIEAMERITKFANQVIKESGAEKPLIPVTPEDDERFTLDDLKAKRDAEKAQREKERLDRRLAKLDQERLKVIEISKFKEKIALAEAAGDVLGVVRIQNEQRLQKIEQDKLKSLISATTEKEKQGIVDLAAAKTEAAKLENARLLAAAEASIAKSREDSLRPLEEQRDLLEAKLNGNEEEVRIRQQIAGILRSNDNLNKQEVVNLVNKNNLLEEQVAQVVRLEGLYQSIGSAIESGLVNGILGAIDGTKTLQESLAGVLRDIGSIMLQFGIRTGLNAINPTMFPLQMAEGGYVSSPTSAIIGEGGEPEYVIPESKMRTAMSRYSRGSRGESVISGSGDSEIVGKVGGTAVAPSIDVRFTVERINSVDYVTAGEFQAGMQQAATQGAKQGEQATLKRLQMSGSTRRRIGI